MTSFFKISALAIALVSSIAMAQTQPTPPAPPADGPHHPAEFAAHKAMILNHMDERAAALASARSCVSAATKHEDLKACHDQERAAMEALRPHR